MWKMVSNSFRAVSQAVPWMVSLASIYLAYSASQNERQANDRVDKMEDSKIAAERQLVDYIDERVSFRRDCEQILEQGKERLAEVSKREETAELSLLNTEALLREFKYSEEEIRAFRSYASGTRKITDLIAAKAHRHLPGESRPNNGHVVKDTISKPSSKASLTIINGLHEDAYVKLIRKGSCVVSLYIRGDNTFTFEGIPDGNYTVMYCLGFGWNEKVEDFRRGRTAKLFDDTLSFQKRVVETHYSRTEYYHEMSLTLHDTFGGNATTTELDPVEFDKY